MHHTARKCETMQRFYLSIFYCRGYSSLDSRELCNVKTCVLGDEFKQDLHIHQDYGKSLKYILNLKVARNSFFGARRRRKLCFISRISDS